MKMERENPEDEKLEMRSKVNCHQTNQREVLKVKQEKKVVFHHGQA